jgi:hypothetical protein
MTKILLRTLCGCERIAYLDSASTGKQYVDVALRLPLRLRSLPIQPEVDAEQPQCFARTFEITGEYALVEGESIQIYLEV